VNINNFLISVKFIPGTKFKKQEKKTDFSGLTLLQNLFMPSLILVGRLENLREPCLVIVT